ncbi:MAG TPA: Mur ligase family protein, partial [Anaerovoracaceae bacterium]|nr:Mur ligase family protein [Anaerovoracaceae bacterium]
MEKIKCTDIVKAVGGSLVQGNPENDVAEISIDSRKIKPGSAFIAIRGERVDGHDYVREAMKAGCSAIICEKEVDCPKNNVAVIRVENTELALQDLAAWYLSQFKVRKIGITGSTGKTTTKEMLYQIMSKKYRTVCNKGNYNNLIGLPLSVFQIDRSTEAAIFEMGMDRLGEIHR